MIDLWKNAYLSRLKSIPKISRLILLHVAQGVRGVVNHQEVGQDGHYLGQFHVGHLDLQHELVLPLSLLVMAHTHPTDSHSVQ